MTAFFAWFASLVLTAAPLTGDGMECATTVRREMAVMGTVLRLQVCAQDTETALAVTEAGFAEVRRLEGVLSSWSRAAEIGRLNAQPGGSMVTISAELHDLLVETGGWVQATGGAFDPAVGALVDAWQLRGAGRTPSAPEIAMALKQTGWRHLQVLDARRVVRGPEGWWLDTGGFGKGAALRNVAAVLQRAGVDVAEIDFGGQLLILGPSQIINVADPQDRRRAVLQLKVQDVSVATSSQSERRNHILDPRAGTPVPAWGSVTVVTKDAMTADVLSTALYVMGPRAAAEWARDRADVGVLILENTSTEPRATWNAALARVIMETP